MNQEPFNPDQFKAGRKAITRIGEEAEFLYYTESLAKHDQLGAVIQGKLKVFYPDGKFTTSSHRYDLLYMAPAEHGIEGMPWDLPAPPAPPEGHKWEYRGKGWKSDDARTICCRTKNSPWIGIRKERAVGSSYTYYLEAVPVAQADPYAEFKAAHANGKVIQWRYKGIDFFGGHWMEKTGNFDVFPTNCEYRVKPSEVIDPYAELKAAHAAGKQLQVRVANMGWCDVDPSGPCWCGEYRIKPSEFPAPPEGRQWHNPVNLTPEQVGVDEGWRLLLVGETAKESQGYCSDRLWHEMPSTIIPNHSTYRTKRPLPKPKKRVPLTADDVPSGSVVRNVRRHPNKRWVIVCDLYDNGVVISGMTITFETLMREGWEIKRPGQVWAPCSKEVQ